MFESDRSGVRNLYSIRPDGTDLQPITDTDAAIFLTNVSAGPDGKPTISITGYLEGDVYRDSRPYEVGIEGGQPRRMHDAFGRSAVRSPDGSAVAFVRGNSSWSRRHYRGSDDRDIWVHRPADGSFEQVTTWEGNDGRPRWAGDKHVLYLSDRERDTMNLYRHRIGPGGGKIEPLTRFEDRDVTGFDVTPDGRTAVLHRWDTLYRLDLTDPDAVPIPIALWAAEDELDDEKIVDVSRKVTEAARNPDGKSMAMVTYGEVYVRGTDDGKPTRRITETPGREKDIAWSPDGTRLYFVTDQDGTESIHVATVQRTRDELRNTYSEATGTKASETEADDDTEAADEDATEDEEPAADADALSGSWRSEVDVPGTGLTEVNIELVLENDKSVAGTFSSADFQGTITGSFNPKTSQLSGECVVPGTAPLQLNAKVENGSMSGELSMTEGGPVIPFEATRVGVEKAGDDSDETDEGGKKADDEKAEEEEEDPSLDPARWSDALQFKVEPLLVTEFNDHSPVPSPDGMQLAFKRDGGNLMILDLATNEVRELRGGWDGWFSFAWSPDSRWIVFDQSDRNFNQDVFIVPADGSAEPVNITRHPDNDDSATFSNDGKALAFRSRRTGDEYDVWYVFLDEELEKMSEPERDQYFKDAA
ncbi:MAG: hypothetical protein MK082_13710, partial [Phycisphaerales bacterium]|nr:hypothetical protein [Phycisphaerales bacterium]